jgi:hypothetical protein
MFAGGGGGAEVLNVNVTTRPFVACGAEDGLMVWITLVTVAKAGVKHKDKPNTSVRKQTFRFMSLLFIRFVRSLCSLRTNGFKTDCSG